MIQSLEISNFRGFKQLSLSNLPQFNFIIGESGSGKTALLEALWVVGGVSPEIYFRMRSMRGIGAGAQLRNERHHYEAFFRDIFFDPSSNWPASIKIMDSLVGDRSLSMFYGSDQLELDVNSGEIGTMLVRPLVFEWKCGEKIFRCPLKVGSTGQIIVEKPPEAYPALLISSSHVVDSGENASRFSSFSIKKRKAAIVDAMRSVYPQVEDLSSEVVGGQQMVYASVEAIPEQIPVAVISSGINKYLSILLATKQYENGVVLIDEIENGFYYKNYHDVISGIIQFCMESNVQLFASTHSYEFLQAVAAVMEKKEPSFSFLRTRHRHDGSCTVTTISGKASKAQIEQDIEVR